MKKILPALIFCGLTLLSLTVQAVQPIKKKFPVKATEVGILKIKAGVVLNSGEVRYVAKDDFYLLRSSYALIKSKYKERPLSLYEFLRKNQASQALLDFSLTGKETDLLTDGIASCNDVYKFPILPDLEKARNYCLEMGFLSSSNEFRKLLPDFLRDTGDNFFQYGIDKDFNFSSVALPKIITEAEKQIAFRCVTGFDGSCYFRNVKPGVYYLSNIDGSTIGKNTIIWDVKVNIHPGKQVNIDLTNRNAFDIY